MIDFSWESVIKIATAFFTSVGGATVVIVAIAKWFGDSLSARFMESYKNKHENELEDLKGKYAKELEQTKTDLAKTKSQFLRYTEKQFNLYNDLWRVLRQTKLQADSLWEKPDPQKVNSFAEQIRITRNAIEDELLLIEEEHYSQLMELIKEFENLIGKNPTERYT